MITAALDHVIRGMCAELNTSTATLDWRTLREDELLFEAAVCIVGSQMVYEMALEVVRRLKALELLDPGACPNETWKKRVVIALDMPVQFITNGRSRTSKPRFKNRIAYLLSATLSNVYGRNFSLREMLNDAGRAEDARRILVASVFGFGPKQASLFLRRVGFSTNLAVIDTHILDYMRIRTGVTASPAALSKIDRYEQIEEGFRTLAQRFGYDVGCVDLATWITMRVAKREAYI